MDDGVRKAGVGPVGRGDSPSVLVHVEVHGRVLVAAMEVTEELSGIGETAVTASGTAGAPVVDDGGLSRTAEVGF